MQSTSRALVIKCLRAVGSGEEANQRVLVIDDRSGPGVLGNSQRKPVDRVFSVRVC